ncbi:MAG: efflux RND transporter periplasmic adaptor subunit [Mesorhizobium sp.]|nr:MAG: efflux RND transporter periplasmic adaptor subunit [Mesorhizobium sp.]
MQRNQTSGVATLIRRPAILYPLVAVIVILTGFGGYALYNQRPVAVEIVAEEHDVPVRVFGLGTVEARIRSDIGFEVGATLVQLNADEGDRVQQGDLLASLTLGEQQAKLEKAKAALLVAEATVEKANANLGKTRAILAQKKDANARKQSLAGQSVVSRQSAEEALMDEAVAEADVAVASSEIKVAQAQLADAGAQLRFEETMLRHRKVVAPYDAIVIDRHKEIGTVVKAGDPIFTLIAADTYWGLAHVDEARAGFIEEGQRVDARLRSRPQDAFTGRVVRIGLESDRVTEERRVFIKGDNPPPRVYLGEQVEFWITVATIDAALLVPEAAVQGFDGRQGSVWTVESSRLRSRVVSFGHRTEDARLEIVDGLPHGASVVARIVSGFREGRSARVVEAVGN